MVNIYKNQTGCISGQITYSTFYPRQDAACISLSLWPASAYLKLQLGDLFLFQRVFAHQQTRGNNVADLKECAMTQNVLGLLWEGPSQMLLL